VQKDGRALRSRLEVNWQTGRFASVDAREGLVLHQVSFRDGARERPIIYRASVTDMIVP